MDINKKEIYHLSINLNITEHEKVIIVSSLNKEKIEQYKEILNNDDEKYKKHIIESFKNIPLENSFFNYFIDEGLIYLSISKSELI